VTTGARERNEMDAAAVKVWSIVTDELRPDPRGAMSERPRMIVMLSSVETGHGWRTIEIAG
jgi:hypothetical protein